MCECVCQCVYFVGFCYIGGCDQTVPIEWERQRQHTRSYTDWCVFADFSIRECRWQEVRGTGTEGKWHCISAKSTESLIEGWPIARSGGKVDLLLFLFLLFGASFSFYCSFLALLLLWLLQCCWS